MRRIEWIVVSSDNKIYLLDISNLKKLFNTKNNRDDIDFSILDLVFDYDLE